MNLLWTLADMAQFHEEAGDQALQRSRRALTEQTSRAYKAQASSHTRYLQALRLIMRDLVAQREDRHVDDCVLGPVAVKGGES